MRAEYLKRRPLDEEYLDSSDVTRENKIAYLRQFILDEMLTQRKVVAQRNLYSWFRLFSKLKLIRIVKQLDKDIDRSVKLLSMLLIVGK